MDGNCEFGYVVLVRNGKTSPQYEFDVGQHTIGSAIDSNIRIRSSNNLLMSTHAVIIVNQQGVAIIKNKSTVSPVRINGKVAFKPSVLHHEDKFEIADKKFQYFNEHLKNTPENAEVFSQAARQAKTPNRKSVIPNRTSVLRSTGIKNSPVYKALLTESFSGISPKSITKPNLSKVIASKARRSSPAVKGSYSRKSIKMRNSTVKSGSPQNADTATSSKKKVEQARNKSQEEQTESDEFHLYLSDSENESLKAEKAAQQPSGLFNESTQDKNINSNDKSIRQSRSSTRLSVFDETTQNIKSLVENDNHVKESLGLSVQNNSTVEMLSPIEISSSLESTRRSRQNKSAASSLLSSSSLTITSESTHSPLKSVSSQSFSSFKKAPLQKSANFSQTTEIDVVNLTSSSVQTPPNRKSNRPQTPSAGKRVAMHLPDDGMFEKVLCTSTPFHKVSLDESTGKNVVSDQQAASPPKRRSSLRASSKRGEHHNCISCGPSEPGSAVLHRKSNVSLPKTTPEKTDKDETPKSHVKPTRRSSKANLSTYNPLVEDVTPVTPENIQASALTEEAFKTPINTPGLFETIKKSVIRSKKRLRESYGSAAKVTNKKPRVEEKIPQPDQPSKRIGQKSPLNRLSDFEGVKQLMKSPPKPPKNDLSCHVSGVANLFNMSGVEVLHEGSDIENSEDLFTHLTGKQPVRSYGSRGKRLSLANDEESSRKNAGSRKTMGDLPLYSPRVSQWVEEQQQNAGEVDEVGEDVSPEKTGRKSRRGRSSSYASPKKLEGETPRDVSGRKSVKTEPKAPLERSERSEQKSRPGRSSNFRNNTSDVVATPRKLADSLTDASARRSGVSSLNKTKSGQVSEAMDSFSGEFSQETNNQSNSSAGDANEVAKSSTKLAATPRDVSGRRSVRLSSKKKSGKHVKIEQNSFEATDSFTDEFNQEPNNESNFNAGDANEASRNSSKLTATSREPTPRDVSGRRSARVSSKKSSKTMKIEQNSFFNGEEANSSEVAASSVNLNASLEPVDMNEGVDISGSNGLQVSSRKSKGSLGRTSQKSEKSFSRNIEIGQSSFREKARSLRQENTSTSSKAAQTPTRLDIRVNKSANFSRIESERQQLDSLNGDKEAEESNVDDCRRHSSYRNDSNSSGVAKTPKNVSSKPVKNAKLNDNSGRKSKGASQPSESDLEIFFDNGTDINSFNDEEPTRGSSYRKKSDSLEVTKTPKNVSLKSVKEAALNDNSGRKSERVSLRRSKGASQASQTDLETFFDNETDVNSFNDKESTRGSSYRKKSVSREVVKAPKNVSLKSVKDTTLNGDISGIKSQPVSLRKSKSSLIGAPQRSKQFDSFGDDNENDSSNDEEDPQSTRGYRKKSVSDSRELTKTLKNLSFKAITDDGATLGDVSGRRSRRVSLRKSSASFISAPQEPANSFSGSTSLDRSGRKSKSETLNKSLTVTDNNPADSVGLESGNACLDKKSEAERSVSLQKSHRKARESSRKSTGDFRRLNSSSCTDEILGDTSFQYDISLGDETDSSQEDSAVEFNYTRNSSRKSINIEESPQVRKSIRVSSGNSQEEGASFRIRTLSSDEDAGPWEDSILNNMPLERSGRKPRLGHSLSKITDPESSVGTRRKTVGDALQKKKKRLQEFVSSDEDAVTNMPLTNSANKKRRIVRSVSPKKQQLADSRIRRYTVSKFVYFESHQQVEDDDEDLLANISSAKPSLKRLNGHSLSLSSKSKQLTKNRRRTLGFKTKAIPRVKTWKNLYIFEKKVDSRPLSRRGTMFVPSADAATSTNCRKTLGDDTKSSPNLRQWREERVKVEVATPILETSEQTLVKRTRRGLKRLDATGSAEIANKPLEAVKRSTRRRAVSKEESVTPASEGSARNTRNARKKETISVEVVNAAEQLEETPQITASNRRGRNKTSDKTPMKEEIQDIPEEQVKPSKAATMAKKSDIQEGAVDEKVNAKPKRVARGKGKIEVPPEDVKEATDKEVETPREVEKAVTKGRSRRGKAVESETPTPVESTAVDSKRPTRRNQAKVKEVAALPDIVAAAETETPEAEPKRAGRRKNKTPVVEDAKVQEVNLPEQKPVPKRAKKGSNRDAVEVDSTRVAPEAPAEQEQVVKTKRPARGRKKIEETEAVLIEAPAVVEVEKPSRSRRLKKDEVLPGEAEPVMLKSDDKGRAKKKVAPKKSSEPGSLLVDQREEVVARAKAPSPKKTRSRRGKQEIDQVAINKVVPEESKLAAPAEDADENAGKEAPKPKRGRKKLQPEPAPLASETPLKEESTSNAPNGRQVRFKEKIDIRLMTPVVAAAATKPGTKSRGTKRPAVTQEVPEEEAVPVKATRSGRTLRKR